MWRSAFLYLSTNAPVQHIATKSRVARRISSRFIAGDTLPEAVAATRELNHKGLAVELDFLGESVTDRAQAEAARDTYLAMLEGIAGGGADSQVSLKPSQMGQALSDQLCYDNIEQIVQKAEQLGNFVWVDIEDSPTIDRTVKLFKALRAKHANVGIAIQAYLHRSRTDVQEIIAVGGTIRLVKGAYQEPPEVAFPDKKDVDRSFKLLTGMMLSSGLFQTLGTHDEKMIQHAIDYAQAHNISKETFEFQMLYGVRRDLQERLVADGYKLRLYVPYGDRWYPYFMRRLAERPANVIFMLGSVVREALPIH
jgi:proline dehydrogenase